MPSNFFGGKVMRIKLKRRSRTPSDILYLQNQAERKKHEISVLRFRAISGKFHQKLSKEIDIVPKDTFFERKTKERSYYFIFIHFERQQEEWTGEASLGAGGLCILATTSRADEHNILISGFCAMSRCFAWNLWYVEHSVFPCSVVTNIVDHYQTTWSPKEKHIPAPYLCYSAPRIISNTHAIHFWKSWGGKMWLFPISLRPQK